MNDFIIYRNYGVLGAEKEMCIHMEHHMLEESVMMS